VNQSEAAYSVKTEKRPEGIAAITGPIESDLIRLERYLESQVSAFEPEVQPLVAYTLGHSGKKIRPILVFYAGWLDDEAASEALIRSAAVVELIHLATLVHDDILDSAELRHRMPTVSAKHGADIAVLLGDALFAHALKLASDFDTVEVCRAVSEATRQVCSGEIAQTFARGDAGISLAAYYRMIDLKTAELFAVSAKIGAYLRGGSPDFVEAVSGYARALGIAYQIYDDIADILGAEERAGKTLGTDLGSGKFTLPILLYLEQLPEAESMVLRQELTSNVVDVEVLIERMKCSGIFDQVRRIFEVRLKEADARLLPYEGHAAVGAMRTLGRFIQVAMERYFPDDMGKVL